MRLSCVTITGADDSVYIQNLLDLSRDFPFVEWGILFHPEKQGSARYPSQRWVRSLMSHSGLNLSAHLCGSYSRDMLFKNSMYLPEDGEKAFRRIQLNVTPEHFHKADFSVLANLRRNLGYSHELIFQYRGTEDDQRIAEMAQFNCKESVFSALYDVSGGRGISPEFWSQIPPGVRYGNAGGLSPINLEAELAAMETVVGDCEIWIDIESGIRTEDNTFDPIKVRRCLEIAKEYIDESCCG